MDRYRRFLVAVLWLQLFVAVFVASYKDELTSVFCSL